MAEEDEEVELELPESEVVEEERPARGRSPVQRAIAHFQQKGLSREDAAAFVFNLTRESGPNLQTNMVHDAGTGYGIAGFRDPTPAGGRRTNLFRFTGTRSPSLEQQLDFMWHELNSSENRALRNVQAARTPEEKVAAAIGYFRPAAQYVAERTRNASQVRRLLGEGGDTLPAPRGPSTSIATLGLQEPTQAAGEFETEEVAPERPRITVNAQPKPQGFLQDLIASQALDVNPAVSHQPEPTFMQSLGVNPQMALQVPDIEGATTPNAGLAYELEQLRYPTAPIPGGIPTAQMSPHQLAAGRMAQSAKPQGGRLEGGATRLTESGAIPAAMLAPFSFPAAAVAGFGGDLSSPLSAAAAITAIPGLSQGAKLAALATGGTLDTFNAEAAPARRSRQTPEEAAAKAQERKLIQQTRTRNEAAPTVDKVVNQLEQTAAPKDPNWNSLWLLGGASVASVIAGGAMAIPPVRRWMANGQVAKFRSVAEAPAGTLDATRISDVFRTQDDPYRGMTSMLARAGAPPQTVKEVEKAFGFQTRAAAQGAVNTAMETGKFETVAFKYSSPVPMNKMIPLGEDPIVKQYVYLKSMQEISERTKPVHATFDMRRGKLQEFGEVKGMYADEYAQQAFLLEKANPQLPQVLRSVKELNKAMVDFTSKGEYSTLNKAKAKDLYSGYKYHIPYSKDGDPITQNPFDAMRKAHEALLVKRMENEPQVMLIDGMRAAEEGLAKRVDAKYIKDHPEHEKNIVTIYRRGVPEHYATSPLVASILKTDVYHYGSSGEAAYLIKRSFERGTTGDLTFGTFAPTAMLRNYFESKFTTEWGRKAPSALGSFVTGPAQQLTPQLAKYMEHSLRDSWFGKQFPSSVTKPMADKLAHWFDNSQYAEMQKLGGASFGPYSYTPQEATTKFRKLIEGSGEHSTLYQGYLNVLEAANNANAWSYYRRNSGRSFDWTQGIVSPGHKGFLRYGDRVPDRKQLIQESRSLTGDPRMRGQYWMDDGSPIRYSNTGSTYEKAMEPIARGYGRAIEAAHRYVPWAGIIQQSMKAVGGAYLENPALFTAKAWMYSVAPTMAGYAASVAMGKDPNGIAYSDYIINGRDKWRQAGWMYFPIKGLPAHQGIEVPVPQEVGLINGLALIAADHLTRSFQYHNRGTMGQVFNSLARSPYFTEKEDMDRILGGYKQLAGTIPSPPYLSAIAADLGKTGIGGEVLGNFFGNSWNVPREDPFDDTPGFSKATEQMMRAVNPWVVGFIADAARAYAHAETGEDKWEPAKAAVRAGGDYYKSKLPMVGPALVGKPLQGNSPITEEYYKRKKEIEQLTNFMRKGDTIPDPRGISDSGNAIRERTLGVALPRSIVGISPKEPTNPLYHQFIDKIDARFAHDAAYAQRQGRMTDAERKAKQGKGGEEKGGIGFKAHLDQLRVANAQVSSMKKVNEGNASTWLHQMEPEQVKYLQSQKVNHKDRRAVQTHYQQKAEDSKRVILFMIRSVEEEMSKEYGQPIKLKDLDPYAVR